MTGTIMRIENTTRRIGKIIAMTVPRLEVDGDPIRPLPVFEPLEMTLEVSGVVFTDLFKDMIAREVRARAYEIDDRCRTLLGAWISGLEPEIWFGPNGLPFGIGAKGSGVVSVTLDWIAAEIADGTFKMPEGQP